VFSFLSGPISLTRTRRAELLKQVQDKQKQWERIEAAYDQPHRDKLAAWKSGTLDGDPQAATAYYNWLVGLCDRSGIAKPQVVSNQPRPRRGLFDIRTYSVTAEGSLEELAEFLHGFDAAEYVHRIRQINTAPLEGASKLKLTIIVEVVALQKESLETIARFEKLMPPGTGDPANSTWLARSSRDLDYYRRRIAERNLFAAYRPPAPPPKAPESPPQPPAPPPFDPSRYAYLTAIVSQDGLPEAWLIARTDGKRYRLREGDPFEVGPLKGKVLRINRRDAEVEIDGQRWRIPIGENLREMVKISDG